MPADERHSVHGVAAGETLDLGFGEDLVLGSEHGSALVIAPGENPVIRFVEVEGADLVVRLTLINREGDDIGSGRVIVVGASEQRDVRLRDEFVAEALEGVQLRIEGLQGSGHVVVTASEENGRGLQPQADPARPRARPVRRVTLPTSIALIDQAENSGALDSETALLYRVYALFGDARLPAQYRGDDGKVIDSVYMGEVQQRLPTLSPSTQQVLQPFLIPPIYAGSWANPTASPVSPLQTLQRPPCECLIFCDKWGWVDSSNNLVRVWHRLDLDDVLKANGVVAAIDTAIWPKFAGLMPNHLPVSDIAESCNGGNGRLDIYLVDVPRSMAVPYRCGPTPSYILLKRTETDSIAAHEIFHAFQWSFPLDGCLSSKPKYQWWTEASAQWAMDFVYPPNQREQEMASEMLSLPGQPLDFSNDAHEYGAYLLPFFVHRKTGSADFVRVAWEKCATQSALEALDQTLTGGFEAVWPEFVRYNWNRAPVDDYKKWDKLLANAPALQFDISLQGFVVGVTKELSFELPRLSATYKYFQFLGDEVRSVAFWNGVTTNLSLREIPERDVQYQPAEASPDETKGARVQALIKLRGQDWKVADWTDKPFVAFCRDMAAERIDELVLIISNSEFKDRERKLKPPGLSPRLWASNMGCWRWKGTATYKDDEMTISTNVTWTRVNASQQQVFPQYVAEGTENWSVSGRCSGSGTLPIFSLSAHLETFNFTPSQGKLWRTYFGSGFDTAFTRQVNVVCDGQLTQKNMENWLMFPDPPTWSITGPDARFVKVDPNGTLMDDSYQTDEGIRREWKWHFEAQREP